jgi:large subunit ribosomal protein L22
MELKVAYRYARVSPSKVRPVIELVRGLPVDDALNTLRLTRKRGAPMVSKLLKSAVATASDRFDTASDKMTVSGAWVDPGPVRKGWFPRPRGMAARMRYRSSHINLVISAPDEAPAPTQGKRR